MIVVGIPMKLGALLVLAAGLLQAQEISHRTAPRVIRKVEPQYTLEARDAKLEGTVVLSTTVSPVGLATEIKVVRGLGKGLDEKAEEALRQWRFNPGTDHGTPIPVQATIEMEFRLSDCVRNPANSK